MTIIRGTHIQVNNWKALKYTDNVQGFTQRSNFYRSLVSSVLPSARLTGLLGSKTMVGKCF